MVGRLTWSITQVSNLPELRLQRRVANRVDASRELLRLPGLCERQV
jgi:hypothetical protein